MQVDKINFGTRCARKVRLSKQKKITNRKSRDPRVDTYQYRMGFGKPERGVITGFEEMNRIYEKIKSGEPLTDFEKLYFRETHCSIASDLAKEEFEELFGPLT